MGYRVHQFSLMTTFTIDLLMFAFEAETGKVMVKRLRRLHQSERLFSMALCTVLPKFIVMNIFMTGRAFLRIFAGEFLEGSTQIVIPPIMTSFTIQYLVFAFKGKVGDIVIKTGCESYVSE